MFYASKLATKYSKSFKLQSCNYSYKSSRGSRTAEIQKLPEVQQRKRFLTKLVEGKCVMPESGPSFIECTQKGLTHDDVMSYITAGFATRLLHIESRIASLLGEGFYTIGPCGEELLSPIGNLLRPNDAMALHYRHLAVQIERQLSTGRPIEEILLDRARGHCVSSLDPVTGGAHCAIGHGPYDFLVTSTLASQAPPAVGRAMGIPLVSYLKQKSIFSRDSISFVSVGDGSVNNAHFLSAVNTAEYAQYRNFKCPVLFAVSDNGICISLKDHGWLQGGFVKKLKMEFFEADGQNILDVWLKTKSAIEYVRKNGKPAFIVYKGLTRCFGHAATDRQDAYLSPTEIASAADSNPLEGLCAQAVKHGITTYTWLGFHFSELIDQVENAFIKASEEPKITSRQSLLDRVSQPYVQVKLPEKSADHASTPPKQQTYPMRKHMTNTYDELLKQNPNLVYIGEDVTHGGYYLVTDGLATKYPNRVRDFPPDETSLMGAAIGFSQVGLLPVLEIPYAKYLDCAADMYFEAIISNWLSNGKQPNGMLIRLQGFDKGVFGGNFHTHNILHIPPGIDVVCYSNGPDYARGIRYAIEQAKAGRVVMSVDSTNLLNLRHVEEGDYAWLYPYTDQSEFMTFDDIRIHGDTSGSLVIVSYGNGVVTALLAQKELQSKGINVTVIDSPCLSRIPQMLKDALPKFERVVFADVCKTGQHPFGGMITSLQSEGILPTKWQCVTAQPTYNPLGNTITFLSKEDIVNACVKVMNS
eukprot:TRINITY_DN3538_c0_g1_i1.p1 TRINITY_DN3538_c0_g1~~TRINITY_DN3538_c0_g1_i1.p1  ORF type:complete len:755 (-),score=141.84 TRINITY_DN3538_c0_g1_i1:181-2445(-)